MKRRQMIAIGTAAACCSATAGGALAAKQDRLHKFELGFPFAINKASRPVDYHDGEISIIRLESGTLSLDENDRLVGKIHAHVAQYNNLNLDVSFAVFADDSELLGASRHTEVVRKIYLSALMTTTENWTVDFGRSKSYRRASALAVAFHDVPIPEPFKKTESGTASKSPG